MADPAPTPWTMDQMQRLAAQAVLKIDLLGVRGASLVSMDEAIAMAGVIVRAGALPPDLLKPKPEKRDDA